MAYSRLSSKGQVTVPLKVREALGLKARDIVAYEVRPDGVVLRRAEPFDVEFYRALASTLEEWNSPEDEEAFRDL
ncbi:type II toxin-antitoxin system PrlF family antitoxin [Candidatus Fermentibacteria bacterium]|nr:type II toxin-antitoxin system PrlF family antitoxin [Candidatus Fermentibacteria bacterium]